jgi:hypothetical protein
MSSTHRSRSSSRPVPLVIFTAVAYIAFITAVGMSRDKWGEAIYFATGVVLIWYTVETYAMRKEVTRQGDLAVMPFVLARLEPAPLALILRNIGNGPALYVKVEDIDFDTGLTPGKPDHVAKFATTDVIEAKCEVQATVELSRHTGQGTKPVFDFLSSLDPKYQKQLDVPVVIQYQDLYGRMHGTRLEMGKNGTRFISFQPGAEA